MWEPIFRIFPILVSSPLVSPPYPDNDNNNNNNNNNNKSFLLLLQDCMILFQFKKP